MGKLKEFVIMQQESAPQSDAAYITQLEKENEELKKWNELAMRKIRSLAREISNLEDEKQALKKYIQNLLTYAADLYAKAEARAQQNYKNDPYLQY